MHIHTRGYTLIERHFLRAQNPKRNPRLAALPQQRARIHTGRHGLHTCYTGTGDLEEALNFLGVLTFLTVTQEYNDPALQSHRARPGPGERMAAKVPCECSLLLPILTSERCWAWNAWRDIHALSKGSCVYLPELDLQEFTFPSCLPLEIDVDLFSLTWYGQAIKTQLDFLSFFFLNRHS